MNLRKDLQEQIEALWIKKEELMDMTDNAFDSVLAGLNYAQKAKLNSLRTNGCKIIVSTVGAVTFEQDFTKEAVDISDLNWEDKYSILGDIQYELNKE